MNDTKKNNSKDLIKFIGVMVIFTIGMIVMLLNHIHQWWIWVIYIAIWTYAELKIAKNIHLKWWVWVLIIAGLGVVDYIVYQFIN